MATLPIHLEVEAEAVGPVLILLQRTPGIIKMNLLLDQSGAKPPSMPRAPGQTYEQITVALLLKSPEPVHVKTLAEQLGGNKLRAAGALHGLKRKGVVESLGAGLWSLTDKARRDMGGQKLLPSPAVRAKANGHKKSAKRLGKGVAAGIMLKALAVKPLRPMDIAVALDAGGGNGKSLSGIMGRGRRDGLIKPNKDGLYELTAKGRAEVGSPTETEV